MAKRGVYPKRKCVNCGKEFQGPKKSEYECQDGVGEEFHEVAIKVYYVPSKGLTINWQKEVVKTDPYGTMTVISPARDIRFSNGIFKTDDPTEQDFLDNYSGCISFEQWEVINVSEKERGARALRVAKAAEAQLVGTNAELEKVKAQLAEANAKLSKKAS